MSGHIPPRMGQLTTDPAVLAKEGANFERIAGELKSVARVQSTATDMDNFDSRGTAPANESFCPTTLTVQRPLVQD
jgi:hypothetical protein